MLNLNHRMTTIPKRCKKGKDQANDASTTKNGNGSLLLLPKDVIISILIRLPVYSILSCKCVCTRIRKIILDPYFAQVHLAYTPSHEFHLVIQDCTFSSNMVLAPTLDLEKPALYSKTTDHYGGNYLSWQTLTSPISVPKTKSWDVNTLTIGSCNGLISYVYLVHKVAMYYVCNPVLGEFAVLPQPRPSTAADLAGFGFCPKTNRYKILRYFYELGKCEILTLGTDNWRMISDLPKYPRVESFFDSSYKGNLHWIVRSKVKEMICSFNLEEEQYLYMSLPSCFDRDFYLKVRYMYLETLDGFFCVSCTLVPGYFVAFVMKDYGVEDSWIKSISIDMRYHFNFPKILIFGVLDNGALVLKSSESSVVYYDTRKGTTSDIEVFSVEGFYNVVGYVPSFISPKEIVRGGNVEVVERRMMHVLSSKARVHKVNHHWR